MRATQAAAATHPARRHEFDSCSLVDLLCIDRPYPASQRFRVGLGHGRNVVDPRRPMDLATLPPGVVAVRLRSRRAALDQAACQLISDDCSRSAAPYFDQAHLAIAFHLRALLSFR